MVAESTATAAAAIRTLLIRPLLPGEACAASVTRVARVAAASAAFVAVAAAPAGSDATPAHGLHTSAQTVSARLQNLPMPCDCCVYAIQRALECVCRFLYMRHVSRILCSVRCSICNNYVNLKVISYLFLS